MVAPIEASTAAQRESLARVRQAYAAKTRGIWGRPGAAIVALTGVGLALVLVVLASLAVGEAVARLQIPQRELVSESTEMLGDDKVTLRVEDGRFAATPAQTSGVLISAELSLVTPRAGTAELRFAPRGEPFGVLASVPDLTGVTKLRIENRLPQMESPTVIEIWLHLDDAQTVESQRLVVQIEPTHGGLRARPLLLRR
ncbi:MAG TPA: hypothetical protein VGJ91_19910 [Polyangiaceae bacterium]